MLAALAAFATESAAQNYPTASSQNFSNVPAPAYDVPNTPPGRAFLPALTPNSGQAGQLPRYPDPRRPVATQFVQRPGASLPYNVSARPQPEAAASEFFKPAETIARVGNEDIFRGDLVGDANIMLAPALANIPAEEREKQRDKIDAQRDQLVKRNLQEALQRKLMYSMFLRSIPPDKLEEARANMAERVPEDFAEKLETMQDQLDKVERTEYPSLARQSPQLFRLALLMKELDVSTRRELDLVLRTQGSSLDKQYQTYLEDQLGRTAMFQKVGTNKDVSFDEMVAYYEENVEDFRVPTRSRWQQVTIRFDRFSNKFEAGQAIAQIGNDLFFGAPFEAVAKRSSHGSNAEEGGYYDWTQWGDFKISREINEAVFSLPPSELSQIIEDTEGLHIVRVIERQDEHVIPFREAQVSIKESIQTKRRTKAINEYLVNLQAEIPVWTIYDREDETEEVATPPAESNRYSR